jgi:hypothetical protein
MVLRALIGSLTIILVFGNLPVLAGDDSGKLIPVRPAYTEPETPSPDAETLPAPSARQQMYVFWILGKMISYPIDKAEAFVKGQIEKPFFRPASSPPREKDPFAALDDGAIPPAPPVAPRSRDK